MIKAEFADVKYKLLKLEESNRTQEKFLFCFLAYAEGLNAFRWKFVFNISVTLEIFIA